MTPDGGPRKTLFLDRIVMRGALRSFCVMGRGHDASVGKFDSRVRSKSKSLKEKSSLRRGRWDNLGRKQGCRIASGIARVIYSCNSSYDCHVIPDAI